MLTTIGFFLAAGAAARLTHLLTDDRITDPLRRLIPETTLIGYWIRCSLCAGLWVSGAVFTAHYFMHERTWWLFVLGALTANLMWSTLYSFIHLSGQTSRRMEQLTAATEVGDVRPRTPGRDPQ